MALVLASAAALQLTKAVTEDLDWLITFLALIAFIVAPLILMRLPAHVTSDAFSPTTYTCGSWPNPTVGASIFPNSSCALSLESRFRWAALVSAIGLAGPYLLMARSLRRASRAKTADPAKPADS